MDQFEAFATFKRVIFSKIPSPTLEEINPFPAPIALELMHYLFINGINESAMSYSFNALKAVNE